MAIYYLISRYILPAILSLILTISWTTVAQGKISTVPELNSSRKLSTPSTNFSGQIGNVVYAPIILDGRPIFWVAAPASNAQVKDENQASFLEQRVQRIENSLEEIIKRHFDPNTLQVTSSILNGETVILVSDQGGLNPQVVSTITQADVQLYGQSIENIAPGTVKIVYSALLKAHQERQPENLQNQLILALQIFLAIIIINFLILKLQGILKIRLIKIKKHLAELNDIEKVNSIAPEEPPSRLPVRLINNALDYLNFAPYFYLFLLKKQPKITSKVIKNLENFINKSANFLSNQELQFILEKQLNSEILLRRLLLFGQLFIWIMGISVILSLFPNTRYISLKFTGTPLSLLMIWLGIIIISKIIEVLIDWALTSWTEDIRFSKGLSKRETLRIPTLTSALKGISNILLLGIGIVFSLQVFQIPITPVLAGAGILGFAISFGSQSVIKDMISGTLNLINDSYAVGDMVVIGSDAGLVEDLNLFVTRVRGTNGDLITIPNGLVGIVRNQTKDWSRVDYQIQVSYDTDIKKALKVLQEVGQSLYNDPQWRKFILESPDLKGIEDLSYQGITLRIWLKTEPGQQWLVGRELRLRLKEAFLSAGIEIGIPRQISITAATRSDDVTHLND